MIYWVNMALKGHNMFEKIHSLIESQEKIIIHRHKNPDGDAFGSQIGLYHILKDSYPEKEYLGVKSPTI